MKLSTIALAMLIALTACSNQTQLSKVEQGQAKQPTKENSNRVQHAQSNTTALVKSQPTQDMALARIEAPQQFAAVASPQVSALFIAPPTMREKYQKLNEHGVQRVDEHPVSTFSIDVDTASYANVRRMLSQGRFPPKDAIRVEEFINYFSYQYPEPESQEKPIQVSTLLTDSPWNANNQLIRVGVQSYQQAPTQRPAANLVFLVDVSGSMQSSNKLELAQKSLNLMLSQLKPTDSVSLVTYAGSTQVVLPSTPASERHKIQQAIAQLSAGGSTYGEAGILLAYAQAEQSFLEDGINQVFLVSDGDLNVGLTQTDQLKELIEKKRVSGIQFSTLGFGEGNYNDHLMEQLADIGNGNASYIDSLHEAQKVLVDQLGSQLQTLAYDVKIQVEFNPSQVSEYRLIGYENRQLNREDFNNDQKDAGEIGAGHTVTALYEITPRGNQGLTDPLVFQTQALETNSTALAEVKVRYKRAQNEPSHKESVRVEPQQKFVFSQLSPDDKFPIAVAAWGQKLRKSSYINELSYAEITQWANQSKGDDPFGYRAEFIKLIRLSESLSKQNIHPTKGDSLHHVQHAN